MVKCPAALQAGAPTPTLGFCSTRANQAAALAPAAPSVAWTAQPFVISNPEDYLPAQVVVDASGRSYVLVNASPTNAAGGPNRLTALDPDGSVAWTTDLPTQGSGLSIGADGTLWALAGELYAFDATGAVAERLDVAPDQLDGSAPPGGFAFDAFAIAADGTFFLAGLQGGTVEHLAPSGLLLWAGNGVGGGSFDDGVIAVEASDAIVVGGDGSELYGYASDGSRAWIGGSLRNFGVDADGNVVGLNATLGDSDASVTTLDPLGNELRAVPLPAQTYNATGLALAADGTQVALLANEIASPGLIKSHLIVTAIDGAGAVRWSTPLDETLTYDPADLTTHYGIFVDVAGRVIVTAGAVTALDLASGAVDWTLPPASPRQCLRPVVLGANGSLVGTQCDGTVFLAR
jgi:sugar lactone lactonase YvrE